MRAEHKKASPQWDNEQRHANRWLSYIGETKLCSPFPCRGRGIMLYSPTTQTKETAFSAGRSNKLSFVTHPSSSPSLFLQPDPSFGASDRFDSNKRRERERLLFPSSSPNFWRQRLSGDSGKSPPLPPKSSAASGAKVCEVNTFDIAFCFSSSPLPPPLLSPPPLCQQLWERMKPWHERVKKKVKKDEEHIYFFVPGIFTCSLS